MTKNQTDWVQFIFDEAKQNQGNNLCISANRISPVIGCYILISRFAWKTKMRFGYAIWILLIAGLFMPYYLKHTALSCAVIAAILCSVLILIRREKRYEYPQAAGEINALLLGGIQPKIIKLLYPLRLLSMELLCYMAASILSWVTGVFSIRISAVTLGLAMILFCVGLLPTSKKRRTNLYSEFEEK